MAVIIVPFSADHVESAAALLAARHRRHRLVAPSLAPEFEDPAETLPLVRDLFATDGVSGVVALRGGTVAGYVLGAPELGSATSAFAGIMHPRAAGIDYAGLAVEPDDGAALHQRLYASLAQRWVAEGLTGHYVTVPADPSVTEAWLDLGFGRFIALGVQPTALPGELHARPSAPIEVRRATSDDEAAVQSLVSELFRSFADPPIFVPHLPETAVERSRVVAEHLVDPACPCWLAFAGDRPVGLQIFVEPTSPHWHQTKMLTPRRAVYLFLVCTAPEARSTGVGAALHAHTMTWAREAGYDHCMAHYLTASRAAPFWRGMGFEPVSHWLRRLVDERAIWARG